MVAAEKMSVSGSEGKNGEENLLALAGAEAGCTERQEVSLPLQGTLDRVRSFLLPLLLIPRPHSECCS